MSIYCSLVVTCWERADSFAILCVTFFLCFVTFQYGVLGQVWYLIVSIPDLCFLSYFHRNLGFSVYMCFVVTCWERADLLALVCGVFCEFVTFPLVSWVRCGT